ncbi:MAG: acyl--CoA ligase [Verrucomicrobia bacterium]|nr:acyl--CoA ligase [Verrucomicrobiota bacterium]
MNFVQAFRERVDLQPGVPALIDHTLLGDRVLSYAALNRSVDTTSIRLREEKVRRGDLFLLLLEPSQEFYVHFLAALQIGAVPVVHAPGCNLRQILAWIREARPAACVLSLLQAANPQLAAGLRHVSKKIYPESTVSRGHWLRIGHIGAVEDVPDEAPALLLLTHDRSGRTMVWRWTQEQLGSTLGFLLSALRLKAGDIDLCSTPLHLLANLRAGLASLIPIGFGLLNRLQLQRQLEKFKPTRTTALVTDLVYLLRKKSSPLHRIFVLEAPLEDAQRRFLAEHSSQATVEVLFGDVVPVATIPLDPAMATDHACCVGNFFDRVEARTLPAPGRGTPAGTPGHAPPIGELIVRAGYLPTPCTLEGGTDSGRLFIESPGDPWLRTGCHGYFDADQRFWTVPGTADG